MIRFVGSAVALLAVVIIGGCRSDQRDAPVQNVIKALDVSVENLRAIHTHLNEAIALKSTLDETGEQKAKAEARENLTKKLSEVLSDIETLKKQAEELRNEMRRADKIAQPATEEEKKELIRKFQGPVANSLKELSKERLNVNTAWKNAKLALKDDEDKKAFKEIDQKFLDAEAEFENLSRLR